jgi:hypothetical protein
LVCHCNRRKQIEGDRKDIAEKNMWTSERERNKWTERSYILKSFRICSIHPKKGHNYENTSQNDFTKFNKSRKIC